MKKKTSKGFSIIEVVIAAGIVGVIAIGALLYVYYSRLHLVRQEYKRISLQFAVSRMEDIRQSDFDSIKPP